MWCEARGEDEKGQILVANLVLNRVRSPSFPDSIEGVITAPKQFSPLTDGSFDRAVPTEKEIKAVEKALQGEDCSQGALYFCSGASAGSGNSWHEKTLERLFVHGGHCFYK